MKNIAAYVFPDTGMSSSYRFHINNDNLTREEIMSNFISQSKISAFVPMIFIFEGEKAPTLLIDDKRKDVEDMKNFVEFIASYYAVEGRTFKDSYTLTRKFLESMETENLLKNFKDKWKC